MRLLQNSQAFQTACLFAGILCLLVLFPFPMRTLFTVARWSACAVGLWAAFVCGQQGKWLGLAVFAALAILLNPFAPILLNPIVLQGINMGALLAFFLASHTLRAAACPSADDQAAPDTLPLS